MNNRSIQHLTSFNSSNTQVEGTVLSSVHTQLSQRFNHTLSSHPILGGISCGLIAGFLSSSQQLIASRNLAENQMAALQHELQRIIPIAFENCLQNHNSFSREFSAQINQSPYAALLNLFLQTQEARELLRLCDRGILQHWSESKLIEEFVKSQYKGVDTHNIRRSFFSENTARGAQFAQTLCNAYQTSELSQNLRNYLEYQGILAGVAQGATFSGLASNWSGRLLSTVTISALASIPASPIIKLGSAMLCGAACSLGQIGFQIFWATRHMSTEQRKQVFSSQQWNLESAVLTGMFCGASELIGSSLLVSPLSSAAFMINKSAIIANFALFNVGGEMLSDAVLHSIGLHLGEVKESENRLQPQTLYGQWLMGAGQELLGDAAGSATHHFVDMTVLAGAVSSIPPPIPLAAALPTIIPLAGANDATHIPPPPALPNIANTAAQSGAHPKVQTPDSTLETLENPESTKEELVHILQNLAHRTSEMSVRERIDLFKLFLVHPQFDLADPDLETYRSTFQTLLPELSPQLSFSFKMTGPQNFQFIYEMTTRELNEENAQLFRTRLDWMYFSQLMRLNRKHSDVILMQEAEAIFDGRTYERFLALAKEALRERDKLIEHYADEIPLGLQAGLGLGRYVTDETNSTECANFIRWMNNLQNIAPFTHLLFSSNSVNLKDKHYTSYRVIPRFLAPNI